MRRLAVSLVGGAHQLAHVLPVAAELRRRGACIVEGYADRADTAAAADALCALIGLPSVPITEMTLPAPLRVLPRTWHKGLRMLHWARRLRSADAVLTAERTSTLLKRLPGRCPPMLHIPHGAGDRAVGFERRIALFDEVYVAGEKDRARMIEQGLADAAHCHAVGGIKLAAMARIGRDRPRPFASGRPAILYNPHFEPGLSSFEAFAERLVDFVLAGDDYDLVIAPHVRLAERWSAERRAAWEARAVPGRVMVDLGSHRSFDMSYTLGCDIYLGDVSSQVYEFLVRPRPCLFVDAHAADWEGNPDYAMWRFGPVMRPGEDIGAALAVAVAEQPQRRTLQQAAVVAAVGRHPWIEGERGPDAIERAADAVEALLARLS